MKIFKDYDISKLNTFKIKAKTLYFSEIKKEEDVIKLFSSEVFRKNKKLFISGGSNMLFTKKFNGILVANRLKGIFVLKEDKENVWIKSFGGELWNDLVNFTVNRGYWGMENLALIPGTVGASPVQNIGAYGVEVKDLIESVEAYKVDNGKKKIFKNKECFFDYRESIFKNKLNGAYFISAVIFKLSKKEIKNLKYKAIEEYIVMNNLKVSTPKEISKIVAKIRTSKLPDPKILGNAGSFFKNVYVDQSFLKQLEKKYNDIPSYKEGNNYKIPTGWLIENCGWKGKKIGNVGVHSLQALVIVNHGNATGKEIKNFSDKIIKSVFNKFGISIECEVNLI